MSFTVKGAKPEWELIYDRLRQANVGEVVTYTELSGILGRDFHTARNPFYKALQLLEGQNLRSMACVPKVGYRVVEASEHEQLARGQHRKSRRALRRSLSKLSSADRSRLAPADRERYDRLEMNVSRQADALRRLESRVSRVELAVTEARQETREQSEAMTTQFSKLLDALRRQGIDVPDDHSGLGVAS